MKRIAWFISLVGAIIGALVFILALLNNNIEERAAFAIGYAVIPYCFAKAISELDSK
jgi:cobalamin synthase